jgi:hypothetical protein
MVPSPDYRQPGEHSSFVMSRRSRAQVILPASKETHPKGIGMDDSAAAGSDGPIDAMPTKAFFVEMLTRDIPLERAVLDLVDNCIDGAKRLRDPLSHDFANLKVDIVLSNAKFEIQDNCGGFDSATARDYAFRFGRPQGAERTAYSIGQFGVGMKRALFKFGRNFTLSSATESERWSVDVDVDAWEASHTWTFDFRTRESGLQNQAEERGTKIIVERLRPEVSSKFSLESFQRSLRELIRIHQRQFIARGLSISFNGNYLSATNLELLVGDVNPAVDRFDFDLSGAKIDVKLVAGVGDSNPPIAGWYIVCNGRVVLAADRSEATGWGLIAEQPAEIPKYHNQFARFRGIAYFNCVDAGQLPWNTTKTGVDADSPVWRITLEKIVVMTRSVIDFLNELDKEKDDVGNDGPLHRALAAATRTQVETIVSPSKFRAPDRSRYLGPRTVRIAYSRPIDQVNTLMEALGVNTAKAVGEQSFDFALKEQGV